MILGIDASNIRGGGGITYLVELLRAAHPPDHGFRSVIVFGGASILGRLEDRPWLRKVYDRLLDKSLPYRLYWQKFRLDKAIKQAGCDLVYFPGSTYSGSFHPFVSISRNMLPFEWKEARRYGVSGQTLRIMLLRWAQSQTFLKASGMIFLTEYARRRIMKRVKGIEHNAVIRYGVNTRFFRPPRNHENGRSYTVERPLRVLYVSTVDLYKHQWNVVEAVARIDKAGCPIQLDLIGHAYGPAMKRLKRSLGKAEGGNRCVTYHGPVANADLSRWYHGADLFVFASTCENLPNILLEAMAAGLPIACSGAGPMPEVLGDAGVYFDPEKPDEIESAIFSLIHSPALRAKLAWAAYQRATAFSWERCAGETFDFFSKSCQKILSN